MDERFTVTGVGEALWDMLPEGARFGGAVTNVMCHAAMLGVRASLVSRVGIDSLGEEALRALQTCGADTTYMQRDPDRPTGTVQVQLDAGGQPRYEIKEGVAWDAIAWEDRLKTLAADADAVCFGTLAQRAEPSRATVRRFVEEARPDALRVFDVNLRQHYYDAETVRESLRLTNVVKLNDEELPVVAGMCGLEGSERNALEGLREQYNLRLAILTRGAAGALLLADGEEVDHPGFPITVKDAIGAGDAFTATVIVGLLRGYSLDAIAEHACRVGAYVCTQAGATPPLPSELR